MTAQDNIDVLIVGAGPVGLFCANELIRHGLTCRIIDKKAHISDKSKALGLHIRTLDVMEDCGFIDEVLKQGHPVLGACVKLNGKPLAEVTFNEVNSDRHYLIDLPQDKTEAILNESLKTKGCEVEWESELTHLNQSPTEITATVKKPNNKVELLNATWLIACDGAHSTVRHQMNAEFKGSAYQQTWWLADLLVDWQVPDNLMAIYITNKGPLACFPMGDRRYRIVMTAPQNSTAEPSLSDITQEFHQRSSDNANLSDPIWITPFTIHHRQIQEYRYDRVFFAGDAAHIHSPMGGQGLNTGIQDIYNLVWKLALVSKAQAKSDLLDSYQAERYPIGHEVLKKTDAMTRMILLTNPFACWLRNTFMKVLMSFNSIKNAMATDLAELDISYAKSPIVFQSGSVKQLKAGTYLSDFALTDWTSKKVFSSKSIIQGTFHHLFLFSGSNAKKYGDLLRLVEELAAKYTNSLQIHLVMAYQPANISSKINTWFDDKQQVHQQFKIKQPTLILVRPDKYIGVLQQPVNKKVLEKHLYLLS